MALYRTGTAAMDAQGVITGTGTKWREPLSLIRTGATIVFLTSPLKLAVISDIVSDTEMKAIQTDGDPVANGNYVILLNDSLTVDGMAQDVAETLRYYQSKETVIEEAIEFFKNFDLKVLQDLVNQIKESEKNTAADRAATEQLKNDTQQIKNAAVAETNQIKTDTNAIKNQTQQIKDSAVNEITVIKNEALDARDEAERAQFAAEQSKVGADSAKAGAETARDEARKWSQQVNPENLLHKDQNLNDLTNKGSARIALSLDRIIQAETSTSMAMGDYRFALSNNGDWGVTKKGVPGWIPLGLSQGGHGGIIASGGGQTVLRSPDNDKYIYVNNSGEWGCYSATPGVGAQPLPLSRGGTGRIDGRAEFDRLTVSSNRDASVIINSTGFPTDRIGGMILIQATSSSGSPYIYQMRTDGSSEGQIINRLPTASGTIALEGTSGREYKKDISQADPNDALNRVMSLDLVNFVYKDDEQNRVRFGVIAEDAEKIAPQYIKHRIYPIPGTEVYDDEGEKIHEDVCDRPSVDVNPIVMDLIGCIHAQQNEINTLRNELDELKNLVKSMINGNASTIPELP